ESFCDVVNHEADDEESPQRELPQRKRRSDCEALAKIVQTDADRDQGRECGSLQRGVSLARASRRKALGNDRETEIAGSDAKQDQARSMKPTRKARLQIEGLGKGVKGEKGQEPGGQCHERGYPATIGTTERGQPRQPECDGDDTDEQADQRVPK